MLAECMFYFAFHFCRIFADCEYFLFHYFVDLFLKPVPMLVPKCLFFANCEFSSLENSAMYSTAIFGNVLQ